MKQEYELVSKRQQTSQLGWSLEPQILYKHTKKIINKRDRNTKSSVTKTKEIKDKRNIKELRESGIGKF